MPDLHNRAVSSAHFSDLRPAIRDAIDVGLAAGLVRAMFNALSRCRATWDLPRSELQPFWLKRIFWASR